MESKQEVINCENIVCEVCQKIKSGMNEVNWKSHRAACERKNNELKRKNTFGCQKMTKFFKLKTASGGVLLKQMLVLMM